MTTNAIRKYKYTLKKQAKRGFHGYPVATIAYYGPDDRRASKVVVGILLSEKDKEAVHLERWFSETGDVRQDLFINQQIVQFIKQVGRVRGRAADAPALAIVRRFAKARRIRGYRAESGLDQRRQLQGPGRTVRAQAVQQKNGRASGRIGVKEM